MRWTALLIFLTLSFALAQDGGPFCVRVEEDVCTTTPREECGPVTHDVCETTQEELCFPATEETCQEVRAADQCFTNLKEQCKDVETKVCTTQPQKHCEEIKKWICPPHHGSFVCSCQLHNHGRRLNWCIEDCERNWDEDYCWTKIAKHCKTHNVTTCSTKVDTICEDVPLEECTPQTETQCEELSTEKCSVEDVERCNPVTEDVCQTVEDQACEKQFADRFCTQDEEGQLRSSIFNGDVLGASMLLSSSENVFSLGEGLMYLPEQTFLVVQSQDRSRDPDVVAFQALATSALNSTDVTKLVNAIILSVIPDCRCRDRSALEYDVIARGLKEDFMDRAYLQQLIDEDISEFETGGESGRKLMATNVSPVESFVCAYCAPQRSCQKFWWC